MMRYILMFVAVAAMAATVACSSAPKAAVVAAPQGTTEVLYFHAKQRCTTCNAIERLTRQVVDSLAKESVVMRVIDISQSQNRAITDKYEVAWSSLILDRDGEIVDLTDLGFGYAKSQPQLFKARLSEAISEMVE